MHLQWPPLVHPSPSPRNLLTESSSKMGVIAVIAKARISQDFWGDRNPPTNVLCFALLCSLSWEVVPIQHQPLSGSLPQKVVEDSQAHNTQSPASQWTSLSKETRERACFTGPSIPNSIRHLALDMKATRGDTIIMLVILLILHYSVHSKKPNHLG